MMNGLRIPQAPTWKEMLLKTKSQSQEISNEVLTGAEDDDLVLLEGDVKMSTVNGIPSFEFFERVNQLLIAYMANSVVVKLLGKNIGFGALQTRIYALRKPTMSYQLMDIENGYYLVKFRSKDDYEKVLS